jgi:hypothetical protein
MPSAKSSATERVRIETALQRVAAARQSRRSNTELGHWADWVKRVQCARFEIEYQDLLTHKDFGQAARFFLNDLYAPHDFSKRDAQFARISGAIERLFPSDVAQTATLMANLHALSEELDNAIAQALADRGGQACAAAYQAAWQSVAQQALRDQQLREVMTLGKRMDELTHRFGLRTALSLMRGPARAAGLSELQGFLERGFDAFAAMGEPQIFLDHIQRRESAFLAAMGGAQDASARSAWACLVQAADRSVRIA